MKEFDFSDWVALVAFLVNFGAIVKAYAHFEHRFTKLEVQLDFLLRQFQTEENHAVRNSRR